MRRALTIGSVVCGLAMLPSCGPNPKPVVPSKVEPPASSRPQTPPQQFASASVVPLQLDSSKPILEAIPAIETAIAEEHAKSHLPSLVVGIVGSGRLLWWKGYGSRVPGGAAPTSSTVFRIGSLTKTITGLALLQLRDAGRLDFDRPAVEYLPELSKVVYPTRDSPLITVRHLVSHTSGLPTTPKADYSRTDRELEASELIASIEGQRLEFAPGTRQHYSNLALGLAALIIERVSGQRYRTYVTEHLLTPLGMTHSYWDAWAVPKEELATGHHAEGEVFKPVVAHRRMGPLEAAAGLYSSLEDLARYAVFQLSAWPPRDAPEAPPLRRSSVRESHLPSGFGFGEKAVFGVNWGLLNTDGLGHVAMHTGSTVDYSAVMTLLPKRGLGVIALTGCNRVDSVQNLGTAILKIVADKVPVPEPVLEAPAQAALKNLLRLIENPDPATVRTALTGGAASAVGTVVQMLEEVHREGPCVVKRVERSDGLAAGAVRLTCGKKDFSLHFSAQAESPYPIGSLGVKELK